ncbi:MAG: hypothetical protein H8D78_18340 [Chloroflexi bacterium]|nr:hypothetical protein [Chloroflexota bacterium]
MEGFTNTLCFGVLLIGAIILLFFVMRWLRQRREAPAGTYDSPDFDSGGSIGGMRGGRAHDSPDFDSGATIGGDPERQAYDSSEIRSGGSIGGGPRVEEREETARAPGRARTVSDGWELGEVGKAAPSEPEPEPEKEKPREPYRTRKTGGRTDSPDIESGGSFGG